ncbi:MAG TPA: O-antigen ligase family protein [Gemmataceae bacterium]|jgi:O-antigen ligase
METVLLALVCLSPWAYGAIHAGFEFLLDAGIALLLALWGARMILEGRITWKKSSVALCLAGLFLLGVWQRTPLPRSLLAQLSPGAARCYEQLLPEQPEILADDAAQPNAGPPPGSTLSLYPGATRREATRLLAVFLVFAVVYNNLASTRALLRFRVVVLINGVLLSLFALAQFFNSPHNTVYWSYPSVGAVFGPFINRNNFPDYVNPCIGLGIGLLVSQERRGRSSTSSEQGGSLMQTLHNPLVLWICAALGLMVSAVAFSRSRGGLLALVGAAVICGVLGRLRLGRSFRLGSILLVAGVVAALSAWFGIGLVKERLGTIWSGEAFDSRAPLWLRALPSVKDFPVWGTGYGTFRYVEAMRRPDAPTEEAPLWSYHAHNDYLEILVEGGAVGLGLAVLALAIVFRLGYRALGRNRGRPEAGLTLGALFAFTALVLHSFVEFGMHIPAIALLATVICAHLCALGQSAAPRGRTSAGDASPAGADAGAYRLRLGGIAPVLGAMVLVGLGLVLCAAGWKAHRIDRLEEAALRAGSTDADQLRQHIAYLTAAVALRPDNAQLCYDLGFAHSQLSDLAKAGHLLDPRLADEQAALALREYVRARDACPLYGVAHLGIANYADRLERGDAPEDYLRRAKLLLPGQAKWWYLCGLREFALGRSEDAWATWRHSLELSGDFLGPILGQTADLSTDKLLEKVLPDRPDVLLAAALRLYPDADALEEQRPFLEKALRLLESKSQRLAARELHVKAGVYKALDQPDKAVQSYREALDREPSQTSWRFEFALYLYELGKFEEARRELVAVLAQDPSHGAARRLLNEVKQELLLKRGDERRGAREER